jgi:hypothetical protein
LRNVRFPPFADIRLRASLSDEGSLFAKYPNRKAVYEADVQALRLLSPSNLLIEKREPVAALIKAIA